MARKFRGEIHVGRRFQKQKNGTIYVLERSTKYDPVTKKTVTVGQKLLGKLLPGSDRLVPTRPKRPNGGSHTTARTWRRHTGLTDILERVGVVSGIDEDVRKCFPAGIAEKILTVARYWVATGGQTLPRLATWQAMHETPYPGAMSEDVIGALFKTVGTDEAGIQAYFRRRADRLGPSPVVAYDSTTTSTYSENLHEARPGFNKDGDGLDVIKLLTLYSVKEREPIAFAKQPGNVPDVISVCNALEQLESLGLPNPLVVTDAGYYSAANMAEYAARNRKFLTLADTDVSWVREAVDALLDRIDGADGVCPFDTDMCGATLTRERHVFTRRRQRTRGGVKTGEEETFERRLHVHVFRSPDVRMKKEQAFNRRLFELKGLLESGAELTESAKRWADRYMTVQKRGRGGAKVVFHNDEVRKARRYFGYFALVTNQTMETFDALRYYRLRERIEEFFGMDKRFFDGRRTRLWHSDALRGRQFAQFVGLGYLCRFRRMVEDAQKDLGAETPGKTAAERRLEQSLRGWLRDRSTIDIFDWFDCIETTQVETEAGCFRWSTESVARDRLFLELLGLSHRE